MAWVAGFVVYEVAVNIGAECFSPAILTVAVSAILTFVAMFNK